MCGIAGFYNIATDREKILGSMRHRGPDEQNSFYDDGLSLFHARLAIQDISGGKQPMQIGDNVIIFNGEIYNHLELRNRYLHGAKFDTHSDTETLLRLYEKHGKSFLDALDGMFAFCIYNKKEKTLFFARDRAGKKPLFIYGVKGKIAFASELVTLASTIGLEIDEEAIEAYLKCGFIPKNGSPYISVNSLPASSWMEYSLCSGVSKSGIFFDIELLCEDEKRKISKQEAIEEFKERFTKSVSDRLLSSELEVGAFLSGGIDSGLVVATASRFTERLKTFTVSFEGTFDESDMARSVSEKYKTAHTQIDISLDLRNDVEKILRQYGHPFFDSSAIPSWYVSKEAKKYVTVVLNGDGADELFGGYRRYVPVANNLFSIASVFSSIKNVMPKPSSKMGYYSHLYRLLSTSGKKGLDFYLSMTTDIFEDYHAFGGTNKYLDILNEEILSVYSNGRIGSLSKLMLVDFKEQLFSDLLVKMDIATMAHSLEGRSPFLSKYITEFAPLLPDDMKIDIFTTKSILRDVAKEFLPPNVVSAPKRGFEVPLVKWVDGELRDMIFDYLNAGSYSSKFIPQSKIDELLFGKADISRHKRAKMLWSMFALDVWYRGLNA